MNEFERVRTYLTDLQGVAGFPRELGHAAAEAAMADLLAQLQQLLALRGRHHHRRGG